MRHTAAVLVALLIAGAAVADPAGDLRRTEIAFAKAFADRDQKRFFAFVADDVTFMPSLRTMRGKQAVIERWSRFFTGPQAPFSWAPERVSVSGDGKIGLSTGPVYDAKGKYLADYASVWRKEKDGNWRIVFDSPGSGGPPLPETVVPFEEGTLDTLHYRKIGNGPIAVVALSDAALYEQMRQLAEYATIVWYEPRRTSIDNDVRDLENLRQHFKLENFALVSANDANPIGLAYAAKFPDRVSRVAQIGSGAAATEVQKIPVLTIGTGKAGAANTRVIAIDGNPWTTNPAAAFAALRNFLRGDWPMGSE